MTMREQNRPLTKQEVKDIKVGTENAFIHPGSNRQWRRSMRRSFNTNNGEKQSNRKEAKRNRSGKLVISREQIKQRIQNRTLVQHKGNPIVMLGGAIKTAFVKSLKIILHKRSNPFA